MVSNTWTKDYEWQGQRYAMKNHGLVRYADLKCVKHTADEIVMELHENEDTLKQYPFHFTFQIHYRLNGKRLDVVYHITNDSEDVMPFSFGPVSYTHLDVYKRQDDFYVEELHAKGASLRDYFYDFTKQKSNL